MASGSAASPLARSVSLEEIEVLNRRVDLDVGGTRFRTTADTLARDPESYFAGLLRMHAEGGLTQSEFFVDRDPTHFRFVLNYLRNGSVQLDTRRDLGFLDELLVEAQFYQVQGLIEAVEQRRAEVVQELRDEPSGEREFKLVTGVEEAELQATFRHWRERGYDFEAWLRCSDGSINVMFTKKISAGEVSLLKRLMRM